ncbi:hypothetical protein B9Q03_04890 [Candidatus Marsarchaeota G2 archaeon OSP_D]|jgi:hypothetical protein|uniref:DsrE family protein n=2 Tax=Candidatus Marsarchaeota group 2 TaxID=2203771 RepID=A0A2R6CDV7_9ARCH|nr:MAG: hypothetical protein B9Q03_04890 [Candidatus Marsarchaeota G2 archaeon OSP_D]PSO09083.1 MAG: hypothetical protein B9Q04_02210 [Candidatus Marsarchaeota G2 archaeon BE_D]
MTKLLFIVLTDPSNLSESIKAAHAFHYATELKKVGHDILVYLDGLGTKIPFSESPYKGLKPAYQKVLSGEILLGVRDYCASPAHLNIASKLSDVKIIGDENNHHAFTDLAKDYQLILV